MRLGICGRAVSDCFVAGKKARKGRLPAKRVARGVPVIKLDEQRLLADVRRHALQLEGLEPGPVEEVLVRRGELAEVLREALVREARAGLLRRRDLRRRVLAQRLVRNPV